MIYDSVEAYDLWQSDLRKFLEDLFPDDASNIEVEKVDNEYRMKIPRELTPEERDKIDYDVRYDKFDQD